MLDFGTVDKLGGEVLQIVFGTMQGDGGLRASDLWEGGLECSQQIWE